MKYSIIMSTLVAVGVSAVIGTADVHAASTATSANCVSGASRNDFESTWKGHDTISVKTRSGKPVCNDVTIYFSTYTLPDNYNGEKFSNNPTAYPQQVFDSKSFVIAKGQNQSETVSVKLPDTCTKHAQVDVYLGPETKVVGAEGHNGRGIGGSNGNNHIVPKTICEVSEQPVNEAAVQSAVTEIPKTGSESLLAVGLLASILTAGATYLVRR